jgi:ribosomal protein S12 methylthiotransferase
VYLNDFGPLETLTPGQFYRCEVTEAHEYDLVARVLSESGHASEPVEAREPISVGAEV